MTKPLPTMKINCTMMTHWKLTLRYSTGWWLMLYTYNENNVNGFMIDCRMNNMMITNIFLRNIEPYY